LTFEERRPTALRVGMKQRSLRTKKMDPRFRGDDSLSI